MDNEVECPIISHSTPVVLSKNDKRKVNREIMSLYQKNSRPTNSANSPLVPDTVLSNGQLVGDYVVRWIRSDLNSKKHKTQRFLDDEK